MQIQDLHVLDVEAKDTKMNSKAPPEKRTLQGKKTKMAGTMRTSQ